MSRIKSGIHSGKIVRINAVRGDKPQLSVVVETPSGLVTWTMRAWIATQKQYANLEASNGIHGLARSAAELSLKEGKTFSPCAALWAKRTDFIGTEVSVRVSDQLKEGKPVMNDRTKEPYFNVNIEPIEADIDQEESQELFGVEEMTDDQAASEFAPESKTGTHD